MALSAIQYLVLVSNFVYKKRVEKYANATERERERDKYKRAPSLELHEK